MRVRNRIDLGGNCPRVLYHLVPTIYGVLFYEELGFLFPTIRRILSPADAHLDKESMIRGAAFRG